MQCNKISLIKYMNTRVLMNISFAINNLDKILLIHIYGKYTYILFLLHMYAISSYKN